MQKLLKKFTSPLKGRRAQAHFENVSVLYEDESLKIAATEGSGNCCFICFTGIGQTLGGLEVQKEEFRKINTNLGNILFIIDKKRSWGNNLDFLEICQAIEEYTTGREIITLGNSMGGFLAILMTSFIQTKSCLAFSPQYSVNPSIVPSETRWRNYTKEIKEFRYESVAPYFASSCEYYCFFGDHEEERRHSLLFPSRGNMQKFEFHKADHNLAKFLKEAGILYSLINAAASREPVLQLVQPISKRLP